MSEKRDRYLNVLAQLGLADRQAEFEAWWQSAPEALCDLVRAVAGCDRDPADVLQGTTVEGLLPVLTPGWQRYLASAFLSRPR